MHVTVSELALRYRFSRDAIYAWVRSGLIPEACIIRIGNSIRIHSEEFEILLRANGQDDEAVQKWEEYQERNQPTTLEKRAGDVQ